MFAENRKLKDKLKNEQEDMVESEGTQLQPQSLQRIENSNLPVEKQNEKTTAEEKKKEIKRCRLNNNNVDSIQNMIIMKMIL